VPRNLRRKNLESELIVSLTSDKFETRVKQKRKGYKEFMVKMISRLKHSGDPKLKGCVGEKVKEEMVFDKEKDWKDHVVRDVKTGEITHEEHEPLSKHKKRRLLRNGQGECYPLYPKWTI